MRKCRGETGEKKKEGLRPIVFNPRTRNANVGHPSRGAGPGRDLEFLLGWWGPKNSIRLSLKLTTSFAGPGDENTTILK
jgi:hypothetical protein